MPDANTGHRKNRRKAGWVSLIAELTRARVTCAVTLTSATGYLAAAGRLEWAMGVPVLGVFLLASGSSALNQVQEARTDGLMARTKKRPIPTGRVDRSTAGFIAGLLILLGLFCLASVEQNTTPLIYLGIFAVVWYNGVYTLLKRVTAFAVVPGALIGAIPPVIGYAAAGGEPTDPFILLVASFFFIWQIPHFWLLLLMWGDQYRDADLPTLTRVFSQRQLQRITFMWILATATGGMCLPALLQDGMTLPWKLAMLFASLWLAMESVSLLKLRRERASVFRRAFLQINVYAMMTALFLSLSALGSKVG
jgi:protoheme IX farnesyltransferase